MTFRLYTTLMTIASLVCWAAVVAVVFTIDPFANGLFGIMLFYTTIFFAVTGTLALAGIMVRKALFHKEQRFVQVWIAFRQAILFALLILAMLFLSHAGFLRWWFILLLIAFFTVVEYLLLSFANRPISSLRE